MTRLPIPGLWAWLKSRLAILRGRRRGPPDEWCQARALIASIDRGGLPLNPARVNQIAHGLGLDVSRKAPVEHTVARIRAALARAGQHGR